MLPQSVPVHKNITLKWNIPCLSSFWVAWDSWNCIWFLFSPCWVYFVFVWVGWNFFLSLWHGGHSSPGIAYALCISKNVCMTYVYIYPLEKKYVKHECMHMCFFIYVCVLLTYGIIIYNNYMPDNVFIQCKFKLVPSPAQCWQDTDRTWSCWTLLQAVQPLSDAPVTHLTLRNVRGLVRLTAVFPPLGLPQYQSTSLAKSVMTPVTFFKSKTAKPPILKRRDQRSTAVPAWRPCPKSFWT